jgi:cytochrome oxidase Cu insertion factor (SCO1/SenC/PrrC family)
MITGGLTLKAGEALDRKSEKAPKALAPAPDFTLIERGGQLLTTADLHGKVWIANLIFTRCADTCSLVSRSMAQLQQAFATEDDVRMVSITVDPAHDTPEALARYADKLGADPQRWLFLTGNKEQIYRLAREGFRMGVTDPHDDKHSSALPALLHLWEAAQRFLPDLEPAVAWAHSPSPDQDTTTRAIQHSERFVLVDRQSHIRHYYNSRDTAALQRLQHHVRLLLLER